MSTEREAEILEEQVRRLEDKAMSKQRQYNSLYQKINAKAQRHNMAFEGA
jgi:chaperonin cofactor prefoldin